MVNLGEFAERGQGARYSPTGKEIRREDEINGGGGAAWLVFAFTTMRCAADFPRLVSWLFIIIIFNSRPGELAGQKILAAARAGKM